MTPQKQALLLRIGFDLGRYSRADVSDWATTQIMETEELDGPLLELGTLAGKSDEDVSGLLRRLGDPVAAGVATRVEIGFVGLMVEDGVLELESAIRALAGLAYDEGLTEEERGAIFQLDDGYDLAVAGTYGTVEAVRSDFRSFTSRYSALASWESAPG